MTMFSLTSKTLSFIAVTPFLLSSFDANEIAFYYLLGVFMSLQALADFGFYNTFVRVMALAFSGGCKSVEDLNKIECLDRGVGIPNTELAGMVVGTMMSVYSTLTVMVVLFLAAFTPLLTKNIASLECSPDGWLSWIAVVAFSALNFLGRPYSNFLLAQNKVALVRRWEGIYNTLGIVANVAVISCSHSIALLVFTNQAWILANLFTNRYLANHHVAFRLNSFGRYRCDRQVLRVVWPVAWRSGLSSLTTQGIVSASGIICNHFCAAETASVYLFAEKLYNAMRSFAQAPFYSRIPLLVHLRGRQRIDEWRKVSQKGMLYSYALMVVGVISFDLSGGFLFGLIRSNITFPDHLLWLSMGWAYVLHRYGAMHSQLYTTINKVNSHISDLIAGGIMVVIWSAAVRHVGAYAFPLGMLCGYLLFYVWFAGYYSYSVNGAGVWAFEKKTSFVPLSLLAAYTVLRCFVL